MSEGFIRSSLLLKISGFIFGMAGALHVARYFIRFRFQVGDYYVPHELSLVVGIILLVLSLACLKGGAK